MVIGAFLVALVASAAPPGVDLEDVTGWSKAADALLDGPPGCYELVGRATWAWDLGRFGFNRGDAVVVGRLHDGVWSGLRAVTLGEASREGRGPVERTYSDELRVVPLLGRIERSNRRSRRNRDDGDAPTGSAEAVNVVRRALDEVTGEVEVAWATWEAAADAVVLHRSVAVGAGNPAPDAVLHTRFPDGARGPDALDVVFPERWRTTSFPSATITGSSVQVRAQLVGGVPFPKSEAVKMTAAILGFQFSGAQTIAWRSVVPCAEGARRAAPPPTPVDPPE